jgi:hypothetical protein
MDEYEYQWGDASVSFPDWVGTAQLDQKMTGPVDLYDLTGVDPDEWLIVGLDFGGGESGYAQPPHHQVGPDRPGGRTTSRYNSDHVAYPADIPELPPAWVAALHAGKWSPSRRGRTLIFVSISIRS